MIPLASNAIAAKLGDVHLDAVLDVRTAPAYEETQVATEEGAPSTAHRQRIRQQLEVDVLISDLEPVVLALVTGRWELEHSEQTRARVYELMRLGRSVPFFDGAKVWRTIERGDLWRVNGVREADTANEAKRWRATIMLVEDSRFQTTFTAIDSEIAASEQDSADGVVDKGQQSTETVPPDLAAKIPA